jgi:thioredoxin 2
MSEALYVKCAECGSVNRFSTAKEEHPICGECRVRLEPGRATSDRVVAVSDAEFSSDVLEAKIPVLVDFFATWCGACRSVEPVLEAFASRYKGRLKVAKLDVDRNPEISARYQVRGTPTLIFFVHGQPAEKVVGAAPERQLEALVEKHID